MKKFSQTDCDIFLEICENVAREKSYTMTPASPRNRAKRFREVRVALRTNEHFDVPQGYQQLLAQCENIMEHIHLSLKDNKLTATYKD